MPNTSEMSPFEEVNVFFDEAADRLGLDDGLREKMRSNIEQIKARRGRVIAIVSDGDHSLHGVADEVIELPSIDPLLSPLVSVVPMQVLAYHIAVERGCDVDQPRNLAKTVTVE